MDPEEPITVCVKSEGTTREAPRFLTVSWKSNRYVKFFVTGSGLLEEFGDDPDFASTEACEMFIHLFTQCDELSSLWTVQMEAKEEAGATTTTTKSPEALEKVSEMELVD